jgi:hypothetical protein
MRKDRRTKSLNPRISAGEQWTPENLRSLSRHVESVGTKVAYSSYDSGVDFFGVAVGRLGDEAERLNERDCKLPAGLRAFVDVIIAQYSCSAGAPTWLEDASR